MTIEVHAVLLDLDGTLLDHDGAAAAAFLAACAEWLPELDPAGRQEALVAWQRLEISCMQAYLDGTMTFRDQRRARVRGILGDHPDPLTDADIDELFTVYLKHYEASWARYDDVDAAMRLFRQAPGGLAVLSNGDRAQQEAKMAALGLDPLPRLFVPADVGASKPEPASFLGVCATMGWNPSTVLYIGDNLRTDALGAARAGLHGCWLERRPTGATDVPVGILRVSDLAAVGSAVHWSSRT
jgi:putative hydrolase of the HAD superfamily